ncbi:hypothetical protein AMECASPLE_035607 [Ameca splendens]|uniref:Uncharacterized protein n=1 Tax=Ameca splendens TaxID=208324 RepID=A0ABV0YW28_9TELE
MVLGGEHDPLPHLFFILMHSTTTRINTFEWAEVGLVSFHTPVHCLPSEVGGREKDWGWESGLVGRPMPRLAFLPSLNYLDFLGSQSLASVLGPSAGRGFQRGGSWLGSVRK